MLFYIPGILTLIVAILICLLVIPRLAGSILSITALVLLVLALYHHYAIFSDEYRSSTWQQGLQFWAGPVMIGLLVLTIIGYFLMFIGSGKRAFEPASANISLPSANTATNPVTATINSAINKISNVGTAVTNKINNLTGAKAVNNGRAPNIANYSKNVSPSFFERA